MKLSPTLSRRDSLRTLALGLGAAAFGSRNLFAEDKPAAAAMPPPESKALGDKLTLVSGAGGNILVLGGSDGTLVIDSGLPNMALATSAEISKAAAGPLALLVNTHWHMDHVGGNAGLARAGARIIASENCRMRVSTDQHNDFMNRDMPAQPPVGRPVVTFTSETQIHLNGEDLTLTPVAPAHTDGDIFVHFQKANVIHMGDLHFNGLYPFIDYSSGGWIGGMIEGAKKALEVSDAKTLIIPGHGPQATQEDLKNYIATLETLYERLAKLKDAGKTVEEAVAAAPTKEFDEKLGKGFLSPELFVKCAYTGLLKHA